MEDSSLSQLYKRTILFFVLFIIVSGMTGSWIIGTDLLYGAGFWIYGNIGKLILLLLVFFLLLVRQKAKLVKVYPKQKTDALLLTLVPLWVMIFFLSANKLLDLPDASIGWFFLTHGTLWAAGGLTLVGSFGLRTIYRTVHTFKKEVMICAILLPFLYVGIFEMWKLWPIFSSGVLKAVTFLLSLTFVTRVTPPYTLHVQKFGIEVAQACSGLDSLFMFTVLYLMLWVSEWRQVNFLKAVGAFLPLAFGLYLINIFRVYLLVVIGVLWSPEVAIKLFHTYAGMILFIVYFLAFYTRVWTTFQKKS